MLTDYESFFYVKYHDILKIRIDQYLHQLNKFFLDDREVASRCVQYKFVESTNCFDLAKCAS